MRADFPDKRPVILTRSAFAGQQRNAAITWSGDIKGTWDVLAAQVPAALNFSMSGNPYWAADIGGFFGGDPKAPAYAQLFTRWLQFAVLNPMFRIHGTSVSRVARPESQRPANRPRNAMWPYLSFLVGTISNDDPTVLLVGDACNVRDFSITRR